MLKLSNIFGKLFWTLTDLKNSKISSGKSRPYKDITEKISAKFTKLNKLDTSKLAILKHRDTLAPTVVPLVAKLLASVILTSVVEIEVGKSETERFLVASKELYVEIRGLGKDISSEEDFGIDDGRAQIIR